MGVVRPGNQGTSIRASREKSPCVLCGMRSLFASAASSVTRQLGYSNCSTPENYLIASNAMLPELHHGFFRVEH